MTRSGTKRFLVLPSAIRTTVWFTILTVPAAIAAYYRIFSGFAGWDDEGTMMMTVRQYLTGARLYEEINTGYGPAYYFYNWLVRSATGNILDHNAVRITSAAVTVGCSLICAWMVLRLTQSLAAASVTHLLVFRVLAFFGSEPGHPQELCLLLLLGLTASGILAAKPRTRWLAMAAAGSMAAALMLTKVNIGIFAILAVALAVLFQAPQGWFLRPAKYAAGAAALLLPFALMRVHLDDPAAQAYCFVVTAALCALLAGPLGFAQAGTLSFRECLAAAAGFAVTFAFVLLVLVWQGVPMPATFNMLVLYHVGVSVSLGYWYIAVKLGRLWIAWAMAGLGAAVLVTRSMRSGEEGIYPLIAPFQVLFGGAGLLIALLSPGHLLGFVTPFCWLLLCPPADHAPPRQGHARILLCTATVLQTLYAYPIAGSQTFFLRILLILVAAISLFGGLHSLSQSARLAPMVRRFARPAAVVTLAAVALAYPLLAYRAKRLYASLSPLGMPGAERIHVQPEEAEDYRWLVAELRQNCDTFVGLPGIPSLYFWTGKPLPGLLHRPPGPLNFDVWMNTFSSAQQQAIADDLSRHPNACAVYHPSGVDFWNKGKLDVRGWPLANYILTHFKTIGRTGDYQFMIRNERQLDIGTSVQGEPRNAPRKTPAQRGLAP
jgi:hypothetical protein